MKKTVTLKFNNWTDENGTREKVITFTNDGWFTKNSVTSNTIPQNEEMFEAAMQAYIDNDGAIKINQN